MDGRRRPNDPRARAARALAAIPPRVGPWAATAALAVLLAAAALAVLLAAAAPAAAQVPAPASHFGFTPGEHRKLADWKQLTAYYEALAAASERVRVDTIGRTVLGAPFIMVTVTSPENMARLEEIRDVQLRLADPRRVGSEAELERLKERARSVVLITHGIHATEVGSSQAAANLLYHLATRDDARTRAILDNVVLLDIPALNPDGLDMVASWHRRTVGTEHEGASLPVLYHHYVGHDNNRDWYAFTQPETRATITHAHNAWHPMIVHDIHQMGGGGARIFFPPYIEPWDPNIDPLLTSSVNMLGSYMAAELLSEGKTGVVIQAIYDAYTPARAYQHYHAGARILSETASANLASPVTVQPERLRGGRGYDAGERSWNHPAPWPGGEWGLPDITEYMEAGAMALLTNAAHNRRFWVDNFAAVNRRAVEGWRDDWPAAWVIPAGQDNQTGVDNVVWILRMGDVEVHRATDAFTAAGRRFPAGSLVIPDGQPYFGFAQTLLERQEYPDLRQYPGGPPQPPYDVTAHSLPLLMDIEAVPLDAPPAVALSEPVPLPEVRYRAPEWLTGPDAPRIAVYKSWREPMTEGWTRWVLDQHGVAYDTLHDADVRGGALARYDVLLLEDQSAESIREGWPAGRMPAEFTGGLGAQGTDAVRRFVRGGGRLVAIGAATEVAAEVLALPVEDVVEGLASSEFYIPGSILGIELVPGALGGAPEPPGVWFWRSSRAFEVGPGVEVLARYATDPVRSGWVLGEGRIAGEPALVRAEVGEGDAVLFGFAPNYRGQTVGTWPLLFAALAGR